MHLTKTEIDAAIADAEWQKFRLSLKGKSTQDKLVQLTLWLQKPCTLLQAHDRQVQVQNYLNALSRGGQIEPCELDKPVHIQVANAVIRR
jgi:hypothetical protein